VNLKLDRSSRRIALAIGISLLLHVFALWGPAIRLPNFKSTLPTLTARLVPLPDTPAKPKTKRKARTVTPQDVPKPEPKSEVAPPPDIPQPASQPLATSEPDAVSAPVATDAPAPRIEQIVERPPLPKRAQLTFSLSLGKGGLLVGEAVHTLEIDEGHYVLHAVTKTVGLASLFKSYELTQYSSGSYNRYGLQPEQFFEERKDKLSTLRYTAEFDRVAQRIHFSQGTETTLPPGTQDILSVLYQFPPLRGVEVTSVYIVNGKKIERYEFEIATKEKIDTALGQLLTVHLRKLHAPNEEGFEIWLAQEYRMFPVKVRFIEKNGDISGEAVITDIRVSDEQGVRSDAVN